MADTAGLLDHMDLVISVDTAISHLAGAMGRPTWIMLNRYATDWRWLLDRDDSPWYPSARLFRQPELHDWRPVINQVSRWIDLFKI
jgi:ADP-heptose:LPS heptosyltransferase